MLGISFVAVSLLLHQQLTTFSLLTPSAVHAASANGIAALPPAAATSSSSDGRHTGDLDLGSQRDRNVADEVDQLLDIQSNVNDNDEWDPDEQQSDADPIAAFRYKFRPSSLASLITGERKQQPASAAWFDGLAKRRAHIFVGKRRGVIAVPSLGRQLSLRPEDVAAVTFDDEQQRFIDDDDSEINDDKRNRMFVGKRPTPAVWDALDVNPDESGRWSPASSRVRGEQLLAAEKRPRMFVGKKYAPVFVGKRSTDEDRLIKMVLKP